MQTFLNVSQKSLFILSGEDSTIPRGELEALVKTYSSGAKIAMESRRIALVEGDLNPSVVSERGAYVRLGGIHVGSLNAPSEENFQRLDLTKIPNFGSFAVRIYNFTSNHITPGLEAAIGKQVKNIFT